MLPFCSAASSSPPEIVAASSSPPGPLHPWSPPAHRPPPARHLSAVCVASCPPVSACMGLSSLFASSFCIITASISLGFVSYLGFSFFFSW